MKMSKIIISTVCGLGLLGACNDQRDANSAVSTSIYKSGRVELSPEWSTLLSLNLDTYKIGYFEITENIKSGRKLNSYDRLNCTRDTAYGNHCSTDLRAFAKLSDSSNVHSTVARKLAQKYQECQNGDRILPAHLHSMYECSITYNEFVAAPNRTYVYNLMSPTSDVNPLISCQITHSDSRTYYHCDFNFCYSIANQNDFQNGYYNSVCETGKFTPTIPRKSLSI